MVGCFICLNLNAQDGVIKYPKSNCHALQRVNKNAIPEITDANYATLQSQVKWDIVCIGDRLRIESPIMSDGGNVFILANHLEMAAPVDTRRYISPDLYSNYVKATRTPVSGTYFGQLEDVAKPGTNIRKMYDDYYRKSPDLIKVDDKIYLPEMPSGLTGTPYLGCEPPIERNIAALIKASTPPTITSNESFVSGNIVVFSSDISFDEEKLASYKLFEGDPIDCQNKQEFSNGKAFVARGLRGGRGGAGATLSNFVEDSIVSGRTRFSCVDDAYHRLGMLNANGGNGGPGGNVTINLTEKSDQLKLLISSYAAVEGGPAGSKVKSYAPSYKGDYSAKSYDACGFIQAGYWEPSSKGLDGKLEVKQMNSTDAINEFARLITANDARPDYNFDELLIRANKPNEKILAFTYVGFSERKFYEILISTQINWLESLNSLIATGREPQQNIIDGIWQNIDYSKLDSSIITNTAAQPLRLLSNFRKYGDSGFVESYFYNSGGMLNLRSSKVVDSWSDLALRSESTLESKKLDQIKETLTNISSSVNEIRDIVKSDDFKKTILELQSRIAVLNEAAKNAQKTHNIDSTISSIGSFGSGVAKLIAGIESGDISAIGSSIVSIQSSLQKLQTSLSGQQNYTQELLKLQDSINSTVALYEQFLITSAKQKAEILLEQNQNLVDFFETHTAYGSRTQSRSALFHDLLRTILIGHVSDPSMSKIELRTNLEALYTLLSDYPYREPPISFRDVSNNCTVEDLLFGSCKKFEMHKDWLKVNSTQNDWSKGITLYLLAPNQKEIFLKTYGILFEKKPATPTDTLKSYNYVPLNRGLLPQSY